MYTGIRFYFFLTTCTIKLLWKNDLCISKEKKRFLDLLLKSKRIKNTHKKCWHWKHLLRIDSWFQTNCLEQWFSNLASQYDHLWRFFKFWWSPFANYTKSSG